MFRNFGGKQWITPRKLQRYISNPKWVSCWKNIVECTSLFHSLCETGAFVTASNEETRNNTDKNIYNVAISYIATNNQNVFWE